MRRDGLLVTAVVWALATTLSVEGEAGRAGTMASVRMQSDDTTYAKKTSRGVVTLWLHPRWRNGALQVEVVVFSHSVHVTGAQLAEGMRLVVNGVESAPAEVGPWHLDAITLVFRPRKRPGHFQIKIRNVPDIPVRVLTW